jgi:glycosyltransferase involved in cell wall biosynthesis
VVNQLIKVLSHHAHSSYQTALSEIPGVEFYHVIDSTGIWPADKKPKFVWPANMPCPTNIKGIEAADIRIEDFDLILLHWHPFIETFSNLWGDLPVIFIEHTRPYHNMAGEVNHWKNMRHEYIDFTVYITESSKEAWDEKNNEKTAAVIYHSIDVDAFPKKTLYNSKLIMTTTNEFITRDWACGFTFWANVLGLSGKPYFPKDQIQLFGYGNDNIKPYAKGRRTREEVLDLLTNAGVYFNPSQMSPIPMSLLEAAAVGTPIVSTAKCEVGRLFKNGVHGIISDDVSELRNGIKELLNNPEKAKEMADNARALVQEKFAPIAFRENWTNIFNRVINNERKITESKKP